MIIFRRFQSPLLLPLGVHCSLILKRRRYEDSVQMHVEALDDRCILKEHLSCGGDILSARCYCSLFETQTTLATPSASWNLTRREFARPSYFETWDPSVDMQYVLTYRCIPNSNYSHGSPFFSESLGKKELALL